MLHPAVTPIREIDKVECGPLQYPNTNLDNFHYGFRHMAIVTGKAFYKLLGHSLQYNNVWACCCKPTVCQNHDITMNTHTVRQ